MWPPRMRFSRRSTGPTTTAASRARRPRRMTSTSRSRARLSLATVFRLEETRTVSNDWVVRYANRFLQLERQSHQPPARSTVQVLEDAAGAIEIRYRDRRMRWTEITAARLITPAPTAVPRRHGTAPIRRDGRARGGPVCRSSVASRRPGS